MPILPRSPSSSIHSWSFVYFKPAGYAITHAPLYGARLFRSLVERHRDHPRPGPAAADVDVEFGAHGRVRRRHVRHADRLLQERRLGAARDPADRRVASGRVHVVTLACDAAVE